jgi:hypothetical protein
MSFPDRIYFNAVFGGLGGLFGWLLFAIFGDKNAAGDQITFQLILGGTLIGAVIGYFVAGVDAIRDRALVRFARLASYGIILGGLGGALGMWVGDQINFRLVNWIGAVRDNKELAATMLARGLGWMFLGMIVGAVEGIATRSLRKCLYGTLGGAIGGLLGGILFAILYDRTKNQVGSATAWSGALGLIILGAFIGGLSALVRAVFQPASVKVLKGWQEGREYSLDKPSSCLGRDEHVDIALFRDMKVEKRHVMIERRGKQFQLINLQAPPENTRVNGQPVAKQRELNDGDRLELGNVILRFQTRAAGARI